MSDLGAVYSALADRPYPSPVFKIHAWVNLTDDKITGKPVHSNEINKHRRDVLRLCALFEPGRHIDLPESTKGEVERFVAERPWNDDMMRNPKLDVSAGEMAEVIRAIYL